MRWTLECASKACQSNRVCSKYDTLCILKIVYWRAYRSTWHSSCLIFKIPEKEGNWVLVARSSCNLHLISSKVGDSNSQVHSIFAWAQYHQLRLSVSYLAQSIPTMSLSETDSTGDHGKTQNLGSHLNGESYRSFIGKKYVQGFCMPSHMRWFSLNQMGSDFILYLHSVFAL